MALDRLEARESDSARHAVPVQVIRYDAPGWGTGELWLEDGLLVNHELPSARGGGETESHPLAERLLTYFAGERVDFGEIGLDLEWMTAFQRAVAETLREVPYGEVVTYGELAALAGHPNAQRAAGSFCAGNRFPILVPCHRVVAANGLGPYGSLGTDYKRRLLALEGVAE
jgi:methylated-DNA-[protein]-cysteine S-methyltransferase